MKPLHQMRSRHRLLLLLLLAVLSVLSLYFFSRPITGLFSTSAPEEIFGLLHFVTSPDEADRVITTPSLLPHATTFGGPVTPEEPVELAWYALGATAQHRGASAGWASRLHVLRTQHPLVVFSKSHCPYSRRAKRLLEAYDLSPTPKIIEVDRRVDADHIKTLLIRLTHHSTFPNIILHGRPLGGSDDLVRLHEEGRLKEILEEGGITVGWSGEDVLF